MTAGSGRGRARIGSVLLALLLVGALLAGCTSSDGSDASSDGGAAGGPEAVVPEANRTDLPVAVDPDEETAEPEFSVQAGTEEVTVTGVEPKQRISLVDADGQRLVVLLADRYGQAHFSYLPPTLAQFQTGAKAKLPFADGSIVEAGDGYTVRNEDTEPVQASEPFRVLGRDDHPDADFYDDEAKALVPADGETSYFGYVTMRDGVQLSVNVRLPGPADQGPYPTVVEYSGYGPSNPGATEPGSMIAGLLGYATVGVNMRGTGCSGGVFDVFNTAQQVDGYDVIEAVARQPWVKDGTVGMVGLSYSGITQLYVAATRPPSLSAITPLSVIKDPWLQQWPGGVYNGGFTKQWLQERDKQSSAGGTSWVATQIEDGDTTCEDHIQLREQNIDFQAFGAALTRRPVLADTRDLSKLVSQIDVPVYLTGSWQDEQTGPQFADMLGNFTDAPITKFTMFNGRHPDGYTPLVLTRWYEFLELYVDGEVPRIQEGLRAAAPTVFEENFGVAGLTFEPDRFTEFTDDEFDEVKAAYEAEPDVRVLFESGAGSDVAGSPVASYEQTYDEWPPSDTEERSFYFDADGALVDDEPTEAGADTFANDPDSAEVTFFAEPDGYKLLAPTWDFDWKPFDDGDAVAYVSEPFSETAVLGGPGYADLYARVPDGDADVQVSVSVIREDGTEWKVTTGLLRLSDRKVDEERSSGLLVERTYAEADAEDVPDDEFTEARVSLPSFAQTFRPGDRLRIVVSSPGRDFAAWTFETIGDDGAARDVAFGSGQASRLVLGVLPIDGDVPDLTPPCPSLRGQPCRPYEATENESAG